MKTVIIASFLIILFSAPAMAQSGGDGDIETVFTDSGIRASGLYGAPEIKISQIKTPGGDEWGILLGGRGGWILNRSISIGAAGYGLVTNHMAFADGVTNYYYRMGMGGLFGEYIQSSNAAIHYIFSALVGGGGLSYSVPVTSMDNNTGSTAFFVLEPGIAAEANITRNFRLDLGVSYRLLTNTSFNQLDAQRDLSGLSVNLAFKFGRF